MAVGHYSYNPQSPHGAMLKSALDKLETGLAELEHIVNTLIQMKDGANLTDYAVGKFGFPDVATATAALAELESVKGQLDSPAVSAALIQAFAKLR